LGYRQIKLSPKDFLDGVCIRGVSLEYIFMSLCLTNTSASSMQHMIPSHWSNLISLLLSPLMTFLYLHVGRDSYWIVGTNVGSLWEPTSYHCEICVLDVGSDLLRFTSNCWKMSLWIWVELFLFPRESSQVSQARAKYSWDGRFSPPFHWKVILCTPSHWLICSRKRKSSVTLLSPLMFPTRTKLCYIASSSCRCSCLWTM
jgi:hypothetical protein